RPCGCGAVRDRPGPARRSSGRRRGTGSPDGRSTRRRSGVSPSGPAAGRSSPMCEAVDRRRVRGHVTQRPRHDALARAGAGEVQPDRPDRARAVAVDGEAGRFPGVGWVGDDQGLDRWRAHRPTVQLPSRAPAMSDLHPPTTHAVPLELPPGATLQGGRYVVERTLGRGGFGITYAAHDGRLERAVALKELFIDGVVRHDGVVVPPPHAAGAFAAAKQRFLREASVLARFTHPGIVRVYEVFEEAGTAYLVMELLEGHTLHEHVVTRGRPLDEPHALAIAQQCAAALAVVHRAGILHRDLNPSNVMLTDDGRVVLIDFGLAREFTADQTTPMTRMVTPGYAPPEQYAANARCGTPTDVYGLAATLYWALTAR